MSRAKVRMAVMVWPEMYGNGLLTGMKASILGTLPQRIQQGRKKVTTRF